MFIVLYANKFLPYVMSHKLHKATYRIIKNGSTLPITYGRLRRYVPPSFRKEENQVRIDISFALPRLASMERSVFSYFTHKLEKMN